MQNQGSSFFVLLLVLVWASFTYAQAHAEGTHTMLAEAQSKSNFKVIPVYFKPLSASPVHPIRKGLLEYDIFLGSGEFKSLSSSEDIQGQGCFGINDSNGNFKCLAFSDVPTQLKKEQFLVYLDKAGAIENLNYLRSPGGIAGTPEVEVTIVQEVSKGPVPELLQPIRLVDNKVPEEEKEKSFLQKYWMYIVPVLVLFLMSGGS